MSSSPHIEMRARPLPRPQRCCFMPILVKAACPECGREVERGFEIRFPCDKSFDLKMYCPSDEAPEEHTFTVRLRVDVSMEVVPS